MWGRERKRKRKGRVKEGGRMDEEKSGETKEKED
jgi:hypothetical protein